MTGHGQSCGPVARRGPIESRADRSLLAPERRLLAVELRALLVLVARWAERERLLWQLRKVEERIDYERSPACCESHETSRLIDELLVQIDQLEEGRG